MSWFSKILDFFKSNKEEQPEIHHGGEDIPEEDNYIGEQLSGTGWYIHVMTSTEDSKENKFKYTLFLKMIINEKDKVTGIVKPLYDIELEKQVFKKTYDRNPYLQFNTILGKAKVSAMKHFKSYPEYENLLMHLDLACLYLDEEGLCIDPY